MVYKKILTSLIILLFATSNCFLQNIDYGLAIETNLATHTNTNPQVKDDGTFQWSYLNTYGIGLYGSKQLLKNVNVMATMMFRQRGYTNEAQTAVIGFPVNYHTLQDRFNFISLDFKCNYIKDTRRNLKVSPLLGFGVNYLLGTKLESIRIPDIEESYPFNEYPGNWKKLNINYKIGVSIFQLHKYSLDIELNRSITPLLKTANLVSKDFVWTIRMNFSIPNLIKNEGESKNR